MKILQNVFSDPRSKVVKLYESSYLFRIAAGFIMHGDHIRSE